ncbi:hypothetical protein CEXT_671631 [Caerostris extrusa]|uniref:Uncharacterized protein n=1 Tax=Caerostris extrusa TaxID=172846 RepID=A0AAV4XBW4_CAEEX|nr:hypothetical protein CEXT_671631 [Caerostris extrusa]
MLSMVVNDSSWVLHPESCTHSVHLHQRRFGFVLRPSTLCSTFPQLSPSSKPILKKNVIQDFPSSIAVFDYYMELYLAKTFDLFDLAKTFETLLGHEFE